MLQVLVSVPLGSSRSAAVWQVVQGDGPLPATPGRPL